MGQPEKSEIMSNLTRANLRRKAPKMPFSQPKKVFFHKTPVFYFYHSCNHAKPVRECGLVLYGVGAVPEEVILYWNFQS